MLDVAHDSYALTLYTFWHLEERQRIEALARKAERHDLAGLMALAFHKPYLLPGIHQRFKDSLSPRATARAKQEATDRALARIAAHQRMRRIDPH